MIFLVCFVWVSLYNKLGYSGTYSVDQASLTRTHQDIPASAYQVSGIKGKHHHLAKKKKVAEISTQSSCNILSKYSDFPFSNHSLNISHYILTRASHSVTTITVYPFVP